MDKINRDNLDVFTRAYIVAALWSSVDLDSEDRTPLDQIKDLEDIAPATLKIMVEDCQKFQRENAEDLGSYPEGEYTGSDMGGHDFWLTRNGHGAGFWDGDWPEAAGQRLTAAAERYGEMTLFVQDDGSVEHT